MIITLSGITGCGKSYYKNLLVQNRNIQNIVIYTTRKKRITEIDGIDKHFVTKNEFQKLVDDKKIFISFEFLGEKYGYGKEYLEKNVCSITELHYEWISDFKEKEEKVYSIYIIPTSVEKAKEQLIMRNLPKEVEEQRLKEIDEHIQKMKHDEKLKSQFDIIFYNDYTEKSDKKMLELIDTFTKWEKESLRKKYEKKSNCRKLENEYASK